MTGITKKDAFLLLADRDEENATLRAELDAARAERDMYSDAISCVRQVLGAAGVPVSAFVEDHVGNAIVQRDEARTALAAEQQAHERTEAERKMWFGDYIREKRHAAKWQSIARCLYDAIVDGPPKDGHVWVEFDDFRAMQRLAVQRGKALKIVARYARELRQAAVSSMRNANNIKPSATPAPDAGKE